MGNAEACGPASEQHAKLQERNSLPWARHDAYQDNPDGTRYITAQAEASNRVEPNRVGAATADLDRGYRSNPSALRSGFESYGGSDTSRSPLPVPEQNYTGYMASSSSTAPRPLAYDTQQEDWTLGASMPTRQNEQYQAQPESRLVERAAENQSADRRFANDETLENRANNENAKQCYFDLELGEAGPASVGHDPNAGPERKWHRFRSGATYDGEWLGGVRDGVGKQCWPDGTVYVGEWRRGRAGGRGEIRHYDGDMYTGEWINGRAHGRGVFRHQGSHAIYEGEFRCDMREGFGVELWVDGSWYAGEFRKGAKHGFGEHRWPQPPGTYYVGGWRANELAGPGRYFVKDGPSYQGEWMNSVIDGAGVYTWPDGQQYEGQYKLDRKHGFGILTTPEGESNECFWEMGGFAAKDRALRGLS